jgi:hypothetical protein
MIINHFRNYGVEDEFDRRIAGTGTAGLVQAIETLPNARTTGGRSSLMGSDPVKLMLVFTILENLFRHRPEHPEFG